MAIETDTRPELPGLSPLTLSRSPFLHRLAEIDTVQCRVRATAAIDESVLPIAAAYVEHGDLSLIPVAALPGSPFRHGSGRVR